VGRNLGTGEEREKQAMTCNDMQGRARTGNDGTADGVTEAGDGTEARQVPSGSRCGVVDPSPSRMSLSPMESSTCPGQDKMNFHVPLNKLKHQLSSSIFLQASHHPLAKDMHA
jgi:hypothetical protein